MALYEIEIITPTGLHHHVVEADDAPAGEYPERVGAFAEVLRSISGVDATVSISWYKPTRLVGHVAEYSVTVPLERPGAFSTAES